MAKTFDELYDMMAGIEGDNSSSLTRAIGSMPNQASLQGIRAAVNSSESYNLARHYGASKDVATKAQNNTNRAIDNLKSWVTPTGENYMNSIGMTSTADDGTEFKLTDYLDSIRSTYILDPAEQNSKTYVREITDKNNNVIGTISQGLSSISREDAEKYKWMGFDEYFKGFTYDNPNLTTDETTSTWLGMDRIRQMQNDVQNNINAGYRYQLEANPELNSIYTTMHDDFQRQFESEWVRNHPDEDIPKFTQAMAMQYAKNELQNREIDRAFENLWNTVQSIPTMGESYEDNLANLNAFYNAPSIVRQYHGTEEQAAEAQAKVDKILSDYNSWFLPDGENYQKYGNLDVTLDDGTTIKLSQKLDEIHEGTEYMSEEWYRELMASIDSVEMANNEARNEYLAEIKANIKEFIGDNQELADYIQSVCDKNGGETFADYVSAVNQTIEEIAYKYSVFSNENYGLDTSRYTPYGWNKAPTNDEIYEAYQFLTTLGLADTRQEVKTYWEYYSSPDGKGYKEYVRNNAPMSIAFSESKWYEKYINSPEYMQDMVDILCTGTILDARKGLPNEKEFSAMVNAGLIETNPNWYVVIEGVNEDYGLSGDGRYLDYQMAYNDYMNTVLTSYYPTFWVDTFNTRDKNGNFVFSEAVDYLKEIGAIPKNSAGTYDYTSLSSEQLNTILEEYITIVSKDPDSYIFEERQNAKGDVNFVYKPDKKHILENDTVAQQLTGLVQAAGDTHLSVWSNLYMFGEDMYFNTVKYTESMKLALEYLGARINFGNEDTGKLWTLTDEEKARLNSIRADINMTNQIMQIDKEVSNIPNFVFAVAENMENMLLDIGLSAGTWGNYAIMFGRVFGEQYALTGNDIRAVGNAAIEVVSEIALFDGIRGTGIVSGILNKAGIGATKAATRLISEGHLLGGYGLKLMATGASEGLEEWAATGLNILLDKHLASNGMRINDMTEWNWEEAWYEFWVASACAGLMGVGQTIATSAQAKSLEVGMTNFAINGFTDNLKDAVYFATKSGKGGVSTDIQIQAITEVKNNWEKLSNSQKIDFLKKLNLPVNWQSFLDNKADEMKISISEASKTDGTTTALDISKAVSDTMRSQLIEMFGDSQSTNDFISQVEHMAEYFTEKESAISEDGTVDEAAIQKVVDEILLAIDMNSIFNTAIGNVNINELTDFGFSFYLMANQSNQQRVANALINRVSADNESIARVEDMNASRRESFNTGKKADAEFNEEFYDTSAKDGIGIKVTRDASGKVTVDAIEGVIKSIDNISVDGYSTIGAQVNEDGSVTMKFAPKKKSSKLTDILKFANSFNVKVETNEKASQDLINQQYIYSPNPQTRYSAYSKTAAYGFLKRAEADVKISDDSRIGGTHSSVESAMKDVSNRAIELAKEAGVNVNDFISALNEYVIDKLSKASNVKEVNAVLEEASRIRSMFSEFENAYNANVENENFFEELKSAKGEQVELSVITLDRFLDNTGMSATEKLNHISNFIPTYVTSVLASNKNGELIQVQKREAGLMDVERTSAYSTALREAVKSGDSVSSLGSKVAKIANGFGLGSNVADMFKNFGNGDTKVSALNNQQVADLANIMLRISDMSADQTVIHYSYENGFNVDSQGRKINEVSATATKFCVQENIRLNRNDNVATRIGSFADQGVTNLHRLFGSDVEGGRFLGNMAQNAQNQIYNDQGRIITFEREANTYDAHKNLAVVKVSVGNARVTGNTAVHVWASIRSILNDVENGHYGTIDTLIAKGGYDARNLLRLNKDKVTEIYAPDEKFAQLRNMDKIGTLDEQGAKSMKEIRDKKIIQLKNDMKSIEEQLKDNMEDFNTAIKYLRFCSELTNPYIVSSIFNKNGVRRSVDSSVYAPLFTRNTNDRTLYSSSGIHMKLAADRVGHFGARAYQDSGVAFLDIFEAVKETSDDVIQTHHKTGLSYEIRKLINYRGENNEHITVSKDGWLNSWLNGLDGINNDEHWIVRNGKNAIRAAGELTAKLDLQWSIGAVAAQHASYHIGKSTISNFYVQKWGKDGTVDYKRVGYNPTALFGGNRTEIQNSIGYKTIALRLANVAENEISNLNSSEVDVFTGELANNLFNYFSPWIARLGGTFKSQEVLSKISDFAMGRITISDVNTTYRLTIEAFNSLINKWAEMNNVSPEEMFRIIATNDTTGENLEYIKGFKSNWNELLSSVMASQPHNTTILRSDLQSTVFSGIAGQYKTQPFINFDAIKRGIIDITSLNKNSPYYKLSKKQAWAQLVTGAEGTIVGALEFGFFVKMLMAFITPSKREKFKDEEGNWDFGYILDTGVENAIKGLANIIPVAGNKINSYFDYEFNEQHGLWNGYLTVNDDNDYTVYYKEDGTKAEYGTDYWTTEEAVAKGYHTKFDLLGAVEGDFGVLSSIRQRYDELKEGGKSLIENGVDFTDYEQQHGTMTAVALLVYAMSKLSGQGTLAINLDNIMADIDKVCAVLNNDFSGEKKQTELWNALQSAVGEGMLSAQNEIRTTLGLPELTSKEIKEITIEGYEFRDGWFYDPDTGYVAKNSDLQKTEELSTWLGYGNTLSNAELTAYINGVGSYEEFRTMYIEAGLIDKYGEYSSSIANVSAAIHDGIIDETNYGQYGVDKDTYESAVKDNVSTELYDTLKHLTPSAGHYDTDDDGKLSGSELASIFNSDAKLPNGSSMYDALVSGVDDYQIVLSTSNINSMDAHQRALNNAEKETHIFTPTRPEGWLADDVFSHWKSEGSEYDFYNPATKEAMTDAELARTEEGIEWLGNQKENKYQFSTRSRRAFANGAPSRTEWVDMYTEAGLVTESGDFSASKENVAKAINAGYITSDNYGMYGLTDKEYEAGLSDTLKYTTFDSLYEISPSIATYWAGDDGEFSSSELVKLYTSEAKFPSGENAGKDIYDMLLSLNPDMESLITDSGKETMAKHDATVAKQATKDAETKEFRETYGMFDSTATKMSDISQKEVYDYVTSHKDVSQELIYNLFEEKGWSKTSGTGKKIWEACNMGSYKSGNSTTAKPTGDPTVTYNYRPAVSINTGTPSFNAVTFDSLF